MPMHFNEVRRPVSKFHKFVSKNTWNNFEFGSVYETINYLMEFKIKHPKYVLTKGEIIILSHLTHL
jgi:hypothetical protein